MKSLPSSPEQNDNIQVPHEIIEHIKYKTYT